jgi:hypothetical protein
MKEDIVEQISRLLSTYSLRDQVEIVANVLLTIASQYISVEDNITPENILKVVLDDRNKNGESLHNALMHQALVMLMWLSSKNVVKR